MTLAIVLGGLTLLFFAWTVRDLITGNAKLRTKPYGRFERAREPKLYWLAVTINLFIVAFIGSATAAAIMDYLNK